MSKETFTYLNSPFWLKHTHQEYRTPDEIRFRLKIQRPKDWETIKRNLIANRKTGAIPFFLNSIEKKFWFFPADTILRKADELEKSGLRLKRLISENSDFKQEFLADATIEEAITSAIYEGANSTRAKAQELITSNSIPKSKDEWMLINNFNAMNWAKKNSDREIDHDLVKEIHEIVTLNTLENDDANFSGRFRDDRVFVHSSQGEIKHEGVAWENIESSLGEVFALTASHERYFPKVLKGIILHYFIAYIHPFFDGNGRTARTLFYLKSLKNGLDFVELLSLSAYLKLHGRQYEKSFEKVMQNDFDLTYFIDFNLNALLHAVKEVDRKVSYLLSIQKLKTLPDSQGLSVTQIGLLQKLALHHFRRVSIEDYAQSIDRSREVSRQELKQLTSLGLLKESQSGKKFVYSIDRDELHRRLKGAT